MDQLGRAEQDEDICPRHSWGVVWLEDHRSAPLREQISWHVHHLESSLLVVRHHTLGFGHYCYQRSWWEQSIASVDRPSFPFTARVTYDHWLPPSKIILTFIRRPGMSGLLIIALAVCRNTGVRTSVYIEVDVTPRGGRLLEFALGGEECSVIRLWSAVLNFPPWRMLIWCRP